MTTPVLPLTSTSVNARLRPLLQPRRSLLIILRNLPPELQPLIPCRATPPPLLALLNNRRLHQLQTILALRRSTHHPREDAGLAAREMEILHAGVDGRHFVQRQARQARGRGVLAVARGHVWGGLGVGEARGWAPEGGVWVAVLRDGAAGGGHLHG